jgi:hypothetical protein
MFGFLENQPNVCITRLIHASSRFSEKIFEKKQNVIVKLLACIRYVTVYPDNRR